MSISEELPETASERVLEFTVNVGMFEDIKGRNNRIRVMGGVLLSQERCGGQQRKTWT